MMLLYSEKLRIAERSLASTTRTRTWYDPEGATIGGSFERPSAATPSSYLPNNHSMVRPPGGGTALHASRARPRSRREVPRAMSPGGAPLVRSPLASEKNRGRQMRMCAVPPRHRRGSDARQNPRFPEFRVLPSAKRRHSHARLCVRVALLTRHARPRGCACRVEMEHPKRKDCGCFIINAALIFLSTCTSVTYLCIIRNKTMTEYSGATFTPRDEKVPKNLQVAHYFSRLGRAPDSLGEAPACSPPARDRQEARDRAARAPGRPPPRFSRHESVRELLQEQRGCAP